MDIDADLDQYKTMIPSFINERFKKKRRSSSNPTEEKLALNKPLHVLTLYLSFKYQTLCTSLPSITFVFFKPKKKKKKK
ncbi:hypothetical protein BD770DRAFT_462215, partial [Pilaira anomala]